MDITNSSLSISSGGPNTLEQSYSFRDKEFNIRINIDKDKLILDIEDHKKDGLTYEFTSKWRLINNRYMNVTPELIIHTYDGKESSYRNKPNIKLSYESKDYYKKEFRLFQDIELRMNHVLNLMKARRQDEFIIINLKSFVVNARLIFESVFNVQKTLYSDIWS